MDLFDNRYFYINKFFLTCIGQWPYHSTLRNRLMQSLVIIFIILYLIPTVAGLCKVWGKLDSMVECLVPIFTVLGCLVYTIVYICKEKKLKSLFDRIESDWKIWSLGQESIILRSHAEDGRILTILYTGCISVTMVLYVAMTLTPQILDIIQPLNATRPKKLPFPVEYFISYEEYFYWILLHIFVTAIIEICVIIGCESVLAVFSEHACGLFSIIGHRLRKAMRDINSNEINCQINIDDIIYKDVTFCIEQHSRAIEFSNIIESCFSPCFFFTTGLNAILISVTLVQVVVKFDSLDDAVKFGSFTSALIIHLFFNSLPAQRLMDHSIGVADDMLEGMWYRLPMRSKKLLTMIIMRSRVPCFLTIGKLYVMSMKNFCKVLQASFSYFTLLSSVRS